jgi:hypothetical protein
MDDRAVLVGDTQTGYGTLDGGDVPSEPNRSFLSPIYDRCLPIIVWIQITLGLPGPTDKPTLESGEAAVMRIFHYGNISYNITILYLLRYLLGLLFFFFSQHFYLMRLLKTTYPTQFLDSSN